MRRREDDDWLDRHPGLGLFVAPWLGLFYGAAIALPVVLVVATLFGVLLLGDELGLWGFDSGLGCEGGDGGCGGDHGD